MQPDDDQQETVLRLIDYDLAARRMYADVELGGDLLLLGLALAHLHHQEGVTGLDVTSLARMLGMTERRVWELLGSDRPRHESVTVPAAGGLREATLHYCGGVLARHFPDLDWPSIYRHTHPRWEPPRRPAPNTGRRLRLITSQGGAA